MTLHEIGLMCNTDKAWYHNFCTHYDTYLKDLRDKEINLLEVGVADGYSLKMWNIYFKNGKINGCDINNKSYLNLDRINTFLCDQESEEQLKKITDDYDVIIDDGGHHMLQQQLTLKNLFLKNLKSGGIYIVEDVHTSLPKFSQEFGSEKLTLNLLEDIKSGKLSGEYHISEEDFNSIKEKIEFIDIIWTNNNLSITSIIKKK